MGLGEQLLRHGEVQLVVPTDSPDTLARVTQFHRFLVVQT